MITREEAVALAERYRVEARAGAAADLRLTLADVADCFVKAHPDRDNCYVKVLRNIEVSAALGSTVRLEEKPMAGADIAQAGARTREGAGAMNARERWHWLQATLHVFRVKQAFKKLEAKRRRQNLRVVASWWPVDAHDDRDDAEGKWCDMRYLQPTPGWRNWQTHRT